MSSELGQEHLMPSERMGSELGQEHLMPREIPRRDWFHPGFVFGAATAAYQVLFLAARIMYMSSVLLIISKISLSFTMITNIEREILMSECMLSSIGLFDVHKKIFYICHICRLKVLGMSMARGQALGTTSATLILVKLFLFCLCKLYMYQQLITCTFLVLPT